MLNGVRKKHGTEVTKIGQDNRSFFTVSYSMHAITCYCKQLIAQSVVLFSMLYVI